MPAMSRSGVDIVLAVAQDAIAAGAPDAQAFAFLCEAATVKPNMSRGDQIAHRPLEGWEDTANRVLNVALETAIKSGDMDQVRQVMWFGVDMLARWREYREDRQRLGG